MDDHADPAGVAPPVGVLPPPIDPRGGPRRISLTTAEEMPKRHDQRPGVRQHHEVEQRLDS